MDYSRQERRRQRVIAGGGKQLAMLISAEAREALEKTMARTGRTQVNIFERLVIEEAVEKRLDNRP